MINHTGVSRSPCIVVLNDAVYYLSAVSYQIDLSCQHSPQVLGGGVAPFVSGPMTMDISLHGQSPQAPFKGLSVRVAEMLQRLARGDTKAARELAFEVIFNKEEGD